MIIRPAVYNGQGLKDYGVDSRTGDIYSFKRNKEGHKLAWSQRNIKTPSMSYPAVRIIDKDVFPKNRDNGLTIGVHQLVHETLCPRPIPTGMTKSEWKQTPRSAKRLLRCGGADGWIVNHKDQNKNNFSPKNLEWLTYQENIKASVRHRSKKK